MQARSPWGRVLVGGQDGSEGPRAHLWVSRRGKRGVAETAVLGGAPAPRAWVGQGEAGCGWKAQVLGPQGRDSSSNYLMAGAGFSDRSCRA